MGGVAALLADARAAGLTVVGEDERLIVRGPRAAEWLALALLARKKEILAAITGEDVSRSRVLAFRRAVESDPDMVRRAEAMRSRHPQEPHVLPFLTVVDVARDAEGCRSCGEPMQPLADRLSVRCQACALAAQLIVNGGIQDE